MTTTAQLEVDLGIVHLGQEERNSVEPKKPSAIDAISQGAPLPPVPSFSDVDKKRRWMLEHMAGAFRVFARKGYTEGMAGHISLRDPERNDCFWTNPLALHFGQVKVSDLILLDHFGHPIGGNTRRPANSAGFQIHGALHRRYPHVNAACHAHSVNGRAWAAFARRLDTCICNFMAIVMVQELFQSIGAQTLQGLINQDVTMFYGSAQSVYSDFGGVVFEPEEGERLSRSLGPDGKLLILRNHGLLTVGRTVDEAAFLFTLAERSCEIQLKALSAAAAGVEMVMIPEEAARYTFEMTSDPDALYYEFQPDYEMELELSDGAFLQ